MCSMLYLTCLHLMQVWWCAWHWCKRPSSHKCSFSCSRLDQKKSSVFERHTIHAAEQDYCHRESKCTDEETAWLTHQPGARLHSQRSSQGLDQAWKHWHCCHQVNSLALINAIVSVQSCEVVVLAARWCTSGMLSAMMHVCWLSQAWPCTFITWPCCVRCNVANTNAANWHACHY